jgi:hypothetical protein
MKEAIQSGLKAASENCGGNEMVLLLIEVVFPQSSVAKHLTVHLKCTHFIVSKLFLKKLTLCQVQWHMSVIPATQKVYVGGLLSEAGLGKNARSYLQNI